MLSNKCRGPWSYVSVPLCSVTKQLTISASMRGMRILWQKTPVIVCLCVCAMCVLLCLRVGVLLLCSRYELYLTMAFFLIGLALLVVCAEERVETQAVSGVVWERVLALCAVRR